MPPELAQKEILLFNTNLCDVDDQDDLGYVGSVLK